MNHIKYSHTVGSIQKKYAFNFMKRSIDISFSLLGVVLLLPVFITVSVLIKLENIHGPIIFSQIRIGKDGKKFKIYKFRTMCIDAEEQFGSLLEFNDIKGATFKMKDDPRVTLLGTFLRKHSIDEFPQLFNVLKGDMSIVGPRPPLEREVIHYSNYEMQRLYVKPGCTGLWQVNGRNNVSFSEMVEFDLSYIRRRSLLLDIYIMYRTIIVIFRPNAAY